LKKSVRSVKSNLFRKSRDFCIPYFQFRELLRKEEIDDGGPAGVRWFVEVLLRDYAYSIERVSYNDPNPSGRFVSIIDSFFIPYIFDCFLKTASTKDIDIILNGINDKFLSLCLVAAHNIILQWRNSAEDTKGGFGSGATAQGTTFSRRYH